MDTMILVALAKLAMLRRTRRMCCATGSNKAIVDVHTKVLDTGPVMLQLKKKRNRHPILILNSIKPVRPGLLLLETRSTNQQMYDDLLALFSTRLLGRVASPRRPIILRSMKLTSNFSIVTHLTQITHTITVDQLTEFLNDEVLLLDCPYHATKDTRGEHNASVEVPRIDMIQTLDTLCDTSSDDRNIRV